MWVCLKYSSLVGKQSYKLRPVHFQRQLPQTSYYVRYYLFVFSHIDILLIWNLLFYVFCGRRSCFIFLPRFCIHGDIYTHNNTFSICWSFCFSELKCLFYQIHHFCGFLNLFLSFLLCYTDLVAWRSSVTQWLRLGTRARFALVPWLWHLFLCGLGQHIWYFCLSMPICKMG